MEHTTAYLKNSKELARYVEDLHTQEKFSTLTITIRPSNLGDYCIADVTYGSDVEVRHSGSDKPPTTSNETENR